MNRGLVCWIMLSSLAVLGSLGGCGLNTLQSARTTPEGKVRVTIANGYVYNEMVSERGSGIGNFPPQFAARYGATADFDVGLQLFMGAGAILDVKHNFFDADSKLALALQAGLGAARDFWFGSQSMIYQFPFKVLFSADLHPSVTPYCSVGMTGFFIFNYQGELSETEGLVAREGHGDWMLTAHFGLELFANRRVQLLVEYGYWRPVVDDPGDRFAFVDNHFFSGGVRF